MLEPSPLGKGLALLFLSVIILPPATPAMRSLPLHRLLELLQDQPPVSTNPRATLDATGQRLNSLIYSGLTRIAPNLDPKPELAESWKVASRGEVIFKIREGLQDHEGQPITAESLSACLEQYRVGKPTSPYISSFPHWRGTRHTAREVILEMAGPDPYLFRNLSLLHYFRTASSPVPCSEPKDREPVIGSGPYRMELESNA